MGAYAKLGGDIELDWQRSESLGRWLPAAQRQCRRAWADRMKVQRRFGGKMWCRARRAGADDW